MTQDIDRARDAALEAIRTAGSVADLDQVVADHLGKRGTLATLKKGLGSIGDPDERKQAGASMHAARAAVEEAADERRASLGDAEINARIADEDIVRAREIMDAQRVLAAHGETVEPAGAATLALVRSGCFEGRTPEDPLRVAVVVSGGNPDPAQFESLLASLAGEAGTGA